MPSIDTKPSYVKFQDRVRGQGVTSILDTGAPPLPQLYKKTLSSRKKKIETTSKIFFRASNSPGHFSITSMHKISVPPLCKISGFEI